MTTNAVARAFPFEITGDTIGMDHEEFFDIDVNNGELGHKNHNSETSVSLICLFVKVEELGGAALPAYVYS